MTAPAAPGTRLTLRSSFYPGSMEIPLRSEVVRETEDGFAVRFIDLGEREETLLRTALPIAR